MYMKQNTYKKILVAMIGVITLLIVALYGVSHYMLDYSLNYPKDERMTAAFWKKRLQNECPWTTSWMDSVYHHHLVKDTFIVMPSGYRAHAIYLYAPQPTLKTAIVVHGYQVRAEGMLHIAYLYNHDMGYNVLLPDLYGHGESEGDHIQMGWKDRLDVLHWISLAPEMFGTTADSLRLVVHGISMGAATTMCVSGEQTPRYVKCFVEDCGYTSVWDEFSNEISARFSLPDFPLMYTASWVVKAKYGWGFNEASPLKQVAKCQKPMLFIHGDNDTFVPTWMVYPLYEAKPQPKALWIAHGSKHADAYADYKEEYTRRVVGFVEKYM